MLANKIVEEAFQKRTSDIHLEPAIDHLRIRYRIDGELAEVMRVPRYAQDALITRFKIMSDMRIDEMRQPQDGRIDFTKYNPSVEIDLRVSTVPTPPRRGHSNENTRQKKLHPLSRYARVQRTQYEIV
jgi:type IV pilus assembly protein PilB